jgi:hypothetical protein
MVSSGALTVSRGVVMGGTQQQGASSSAGTATAAVVSAAGVGGSVVSLLSSRPWTKAPLHGEVPLLDTIQSLFTTAEEKTAATLVISEIVESNHFNKFTKNQQNCIILALEGITTTEVINIVTVMRTAYTASPMPIATPFDFSQFLSAKSTHNAWCHIIGSSKRVQLKKGDVISFSNPVSIC